jgi:hypothetical protein
VQYSQNDLYCGTEGVPNKRMFISSLTFLETKFVILSKHPRVAKYRNSLETQIVLLERSRKISNLKNFLSKDSPMLVQKDTDLVEKMTPLICKE